MLTGGSCLSRPERTHRRTRSPRRGPDSFRCRRCRLDVPLTAPGTQHRNHCPNCLWSRHVDDDVPGDRAAECSASMEPISVSVREDGEWALVHRCTACSTVHVNRIAGDDNPLVLMRLAVRPLARPPFPLEWLTRM
jgi:RNHCP domain